MAIPFFLLAGELMSSSGITPRLVNFSNCILGHLRGGLSHVNILVSILFAGLTGSAAADTSAIGSILIPAMEEDGYDIDFSTAVTAASSVIGPIIPPSIIMVIYAFAMNVSVAGLFLAGVIPGIILGFSLMIYCYFISKTRDYPKSEKRASFKKLLGATIETAPAFGIPIIILGGILAGICTPTEAAALADAYIILLAVVFLRTLKIKDLPKIFLRSAINSGAVLFMIAASMIFGWLAATGGLADTVEHLIRSISTNYYVVLILINMSLLIVGMFIDTIPAILILGPVLLPIAMDLGVYPLHFAIIMCVNLTVGLITPPVGTILFVGCGITGLSMERLGRAVIPFIIIEFIIVLLITFIEPLSMTIPKIAGFY
jgi:tripartite ATP-independent transporter DctM subunit